MQTTTRENSVPASRQCKVKDCDPLCLRTEGWTGQSGRRGHENNLAQLIVSYHIQQVSLRSLSYHFVFNETPEKVFVALRQSQFLMSSPFTLVSTDFISKPSHRVMMVF